MNKYKYIAKVRLFFYIFYFYFDIEGFIIIERVEEFNITIKKAAAITVTVIFSSSIYF